MCYFNNFSLVPVIYTALHGSYGVLWYLKHCVFPDKNWDQRLTFISTITMSLALSFYWGFGLSVISGCSETVGKIRISLCVALYALGAVLMMVSDA